MSRLIKSYSPAVPIEEKKVISIRHLHSHLNHNEEEVEQCSVRPYEEVQAMLNKAHEEAEWIVNTARIDSENLARQMEEQRGVLEQEKQKVFEEARTHGFAAGAEEGRQSALTEYTDLIQMAREVVDSAKHDYQQHIESSERTILDLGLKVAGKILGEVLEQDSDQFLSIVKRALKEAREYTEIQLHVHPVHYDLVLSHKEELIRVFPKETDLYIYPDEELSNTSCVIESANGRIEASVDSQLEEIKSKLFEMLESESN
ncbi:MULTISPECIES: flagellar assembly protein FliH [unclassified Cytobacillus]|uniref:flagellar assembly protein FliH n=1 Tax=unclassified Cytobacillus TaxID=2675268 RepID=UPI001359A51B|nr:flagellar assembly protein FliH [Cytobacillus sp. AMY 15.2]KAF0820370.1 Flagellar assembly protein FliH [Bacillus sp. ZZV12-4809]MCM3089593.1 flagellar assembly protein FliH [Cytobacillus sp. AMY 15.2]